MTDSAQNPNPPGTTGSGAPDTPALKPALHRLLRKVVPPPGAAAPPDPHACEVLYHGDDIQRFSGLRAQAHRLADDPAAFIAYFADYLSAESLEFERHQRFRAAAANHQISDDYDQVTNTYESIDDISRQFFAARKLASDPAHRVLSQDADRVFRRTMQLYKSILQASRLAGK